MHSLAVRDDRKLSSKELDTIALAAEHALGALAPVLETIETGKGTAKGNARKQFEPRRVLPEGEEGGATPADGPIMATLGEQKEMDRPAASATACWPISSAMPPSTATRRVTSSARRRTTCV